ncbi:deoxyribonuclease IV [Candidatus Dependentiae bacterium]|nr:deoxyribonuclease IV [Candidatus Dependentiae bacterium]
MPNKVPPLIGAHISIAGGFCKAIERAQALGATTMQIFTKSSRSWFEKPISDDEVKAFKKALKQSKLKKIMAHSSYLINIASTNPETEKNSATALKHELKRCEQLGIPYLVMHPGSHLGAGEQEGIKKICKNLDKILAQASGTTKILLETMAGQGTNLGHTFEQIKSIIANCAHKKLLGVCLDTCHIFAAGYDIRTEEAYKKTIKQFAQIIGIRKLQALHLNDSKTGLDSHKDRHESLGEGHIPRTTFKYIMQDKRFAKIPKILETPDPNLYAKEINMLNRMAQ